MWSIQKNHSGHNEPWKPGTGKPVPANELAEPRSARLFDEKPLSASTAHVGRKAVCVLCSAPTEEAICGTCADKIRAEAVEHKRWEEMVGTEVFCNSDSIEVIRAKARGKNLKGAVQ